LRLRVTMPDGRASFAVIPGLRQVSKQRLTKTMGSVRSEDLHRLDRALRFYLGDEEDEQS